jgi:predicted DNA-binding protein
MAVSEENTRILITMPKEAKGRLEKKAKSENRSVSNYVLNLILKDVESGE